MSWLFVIAKEMRPSTIGGRVLNPSAFLDLLCPLIRGTDFSGDGVRSVPFARMDDLFRVRPLLSAGNGGHTENQSRYHERDGKKYLKREHTLPVTGCKAHVMTRDAYLTFRAKAHPPDDDKDLPLPPEEATHVLVSVTIMDGAYGRGDVPCWPVADEM
jgi:hypothetical protein